MPITEATGDIFQTKLSHIVIPVNTVGVMGAGIARKARDLWPKAAASYRHYCLSYPGLQIGELLWYDNRICLLPTKQHWRDPSELSYVQQGVDALGRVLLTHPNMSVAIPALGCGCGGLPWSKVKPIIVGLLKDVPNTVHLYPPQ